MTSELARLFFLLGIIMLAFCAGYSIGWNECRETVKKEGLGE